MILVLPTILLPMTRIRKCLFSCLELLSMLEVGTQLMRLLLRPASTRVSVMMMCGQESGVSRGQRGTGVAR